MKKEEALEYLIKTCHNLVINMNDTFYYACSDTSEVPSEDALDLVPYIQFYGFNALLAYESIKRGHNPEISDYLTPEFLEVKEILIKKMQEESDFLCSLNYEKKEELEQIKEFGGKLSFKFLKPSFIEKFLGQSYYNCFCYCDGQKIKGKGKNMLEAKQDLKIKLEKRRLK